jgi:hypothetical protein
MTPSHKENCRHGLNTVLQPQLLRKRGRPPSYNCGKVNGIKLHFAYNCFSSGSKRRKKQIYMLIFTFYIIFMILTSSK